MGAGAGPAKGGAGVQQQPGRPRDEGVRAPSGRSVEARGTVADVTDEAQVRLVRRERKPKQDHRPILVNNAGVLPAHRAVPLEAADFRRVVDGGPGGSLSHGPGSAAGRGAPEVTADHQRRSLMSEVGRETVSAYAAAKRAG